MLWQTFFIQMSCKESILSLFCICVLKRPTYLYVASLTTNHAYHHFYWPIFDTCYISLVFWYILPTTPVYDNGQQSLSHRYSKEIKQLFIRRSQWITQTYTFYLRFLYHLHEQKTAAPSTLRSPDVHSVHPNTDTANSKLSCCLLGKSQRVHS